MMDSKIVTTGDDVKDLEKKKKKRSISENVERAGQAIFEEIVQYFTPCKVVILCGPGNNGGDGFVLARLLRNANWRVVVALQPGSSNRYATISEKNLKLFDGEIIVLEKVEFEDYDLIVDALFGEGLNRHVKGSYFEIIERANKSSLPIVSIDIPSGLDQDLEIMGSAISAEITINFGSIKPHHMGKNTINNAGKIIIKDIKDNLF